MRELKFRAWLDEYKQYLYFGGDYKEPTGRWGKGRCALLGDNYIAELYANEDNSNMFYQIHKVECIEQYTGLKDKNGKEIYEGDIVRIDRMDEIRVGYVELVADQYCIVCGEDEEGNKIVAEFYYYSKPEENCKVIGNIHENAELLKKNNEE